MLGKWRAERVLPRVPGLGAAPVGGSQWGRSTRKPREPAQLRCPQRGSYGYLPDSLKPATCPSICLPCLSLSEAYRTCWGRYPYPGAGKDFQKGPQPGWAVPSSRRSMLACSHLDQKDISAMAMSAVD